VIAPTARNRHTVRLIGCDRVLFERIRASLRRSPFLFLSADESEAAQADLQVAPAALCLRRAGAPEALPPIIAYGPAGLLRAAFLAGCEDYLKDPWTPEELEMRLLAALARARRSFLFPWGEISFEGKDLRTPAGLVELSHYESRLLGALLRNRGAPVSREALGYSLWEKPAAERSRAIDAHAAAVRRKISAAVPAAGRRFVVAVRGRGYMVP
jgi:CheY-like chemotaxis protein